MAAKSGVSLGSIKRFEQIGEISLQSLTKLAIALEVEEEIADGFSISPFSLPLEKKVFMPKMDPFDGIFGVFADSLPDGWGRLLVDRLMRRNGINPYEVGSLDRLAIVGSSGMGALTYQPVISIADTMEEKRLDEIAVECERVEQDLKY